MKGREYSGGKDEQDADKLRLGQSCIDFRVAREEFDEEPAESSPEEIKRNLRALPGARVDFGPAAKPEENKKNESVCDLVERRWVDTDHGGNDAVWKAHAPGQ